MLVLLQLGIHSLDLNLMVHDFRIKLLDLLSVVMCVTLLFFLGAISFILKFMDSVLNFIVDLLFILKLVFQFLDLLSFHVVFLLHVLELEVFIPNLLA